MMDTRFSTKICLSNQILIVTPYYAKMCNLSARFIHVSLRLDQGLSKWQCAGTETHLGSTWFGHGPWSNASRQE